MGKGKGCWFWVQERVSWEQLTRRLLEPSIDCRVLNKVVLYKVPTSYSDASSPDQTSFLSPSSSELRSSISERGNQRDRDRERAQARSGNKTKQTKSDGLTPEQRRERDAKALQEKAAKKAAQAQAAGGNNAGGKK
ncbi:hypothetical protein M0R45_010350 [Rubus argutus]|uniref:Small EDRK-rich factor-like N-terminal domain-containing protein n=1 Tax=Rubus argutus TaxID=59490 RepID=A0AAW1Y8J1_RUBAR